MEDVKGKISDDEGKKKSKKKMSKKNLSSDGKNYYIEKFQGVDYQEK